MGFKVWLFLVFVNVVFAVGNTYFVATGGVDNIVSNGAALLCGLVALALLVSTRKNWG